MEIIKNPEQIKLQMQDCNGEIHELTVNPITRKRMREFTESVKNKAEDTDQVYDFLVQQLCFFTGKEESFFDNFHISVIGSAVTYISGELQRPFLQMQKSEGS